MTTSIEKQEVRIGDTVQVSVTAEIKGNFDGGYLVYIPKARLFTAIRNEQMQGLVEKRRARKTKSQPEKHLEFAASNMLSRLEFDIEKDKENIRQFLEEFAEHVLWHTTPASGNTIKQYQGMTVEQIAKHVPDMEVEL